MAERLYKTDGLSSEQVDALDDMSTSYRELESRSSSVQVGFLDQFGGQLRQILEEQGLDMDNPSVHFAVLVGASVMCDAVNKAADSGHSIKATSSIVMGAIVGSRPLVGLE